MTKFDHISDEELISSERYDRGDVVDYIFDKYKYLINIYANKYFIIGADREDVIQEGMIGLFKAIDDFDVSKNVKFSTFASLCIGRQITKAIEAAGRLKNKPLNDYISIYEPEDSYDEGGVHIADIPSSDSNPLNQIIDNEKVNRILDAIESKLSKMEKVVFSYMMDGLSYRDIIDKMGKSDKSIDNCIQRIRKKAKELL